jgi:hypothetical protein
LKNDYTQIHTKWTSTPLDTKTSVFHRYTTYGCMRQLCWWWVQIAPEKCTADDERNKEHSVHLVGSELNINTELYSVFMRILPLCNVKGGTFLVESNCINVRLNTTVFSNYWRNQLQVLTLFWVGHHQVETRIWEKTRILQCGHQEWGNEISFYNVWGWCHQRGTFRHTVVVCLSYYYQRPVYTRPVDWQDKWTSTGNLPQVNSPMWPLTFLKFEARQLAWQAARQGKWIEGSSIFETSCPPPPFICHAWTPTASTAQLAGLCLLSVSVVVVQFQYLKLNLWTLCERYMLRYLLSFTCSKLLVHLPCCSRVNRP